MRESKFSEGIIKIDGKSYQKVSIRVPHDFFVECPYCGYQFDCSGDSHVATCESCKKEFWAEETGHI